MYILVYLKKNQNYSIFNVHFEKIFINGVSRGFYKTSY